MATWGAVFFDEEAGYFFLAATRSAEPFLLEADLSAIYLGSSAAIATLLLRTIFCGAADLRPEVAVTDLTDSIFIVVGLSLPVIDLPGGIMIAPTGFFLAPFLALISKVGFFPDFKLFLALPGRLVLSVELDPFF